MVAPMSRPQSHQARRRAVLALRVIAVGLPFAVIAAPAGATTTVIGTALQSSDQASTMSQNGDNHVSPLPVVGKNQSTGTQRGTSSLANSESIPLGEGGLLDGKATQNSTQGSATTQINAGSKTQTSDATGALVNDQLIGGGGLIIGDTGQSNGQGNLISQTSTGSKSAALTAAASLANTQIVGDRDGVILGSTSQISGQADNTAQAITQKASNPTIGASKLNATSISTSNLSNAQGVAAATILGSTQQGSTQGHTGKQSTNQSPGAVIIGSYLPRQTTDNSVGLSNCQTVSDGSASCMLLP